MLCVNLYIAPNPFAHSTYALCMIVRTEYAIGKIGPYSWLPHGNKYTFLLKLDYSQMWHLRLIASDIHCCCCCCCLCGYNWETYITDETHRSFVYNVYYKIFVYRTFTFIFLTINAHGRQIHTICIHRQSFLKILKWTNNSPIHKHNGLVHILICI